VGLAELAQLEQLAELGQLGQLGRAGAASARDMAVAGTVRTATRLGLLVLQPTPFCNLDCRYCYLPDRANRARMTMATLAAAVAQVVEAGLLGEEVSIVWHAGEPLVVPRAWYAEAFARVRDLVPTSTRVEHHVQINATLVDRAWCDFIVEHGIRVGVSVDGPALLHDAARHTRRGEGTHAQAMRGVARLQAAGIPIHAICVLGRASLDHPDAIYDFFVDAGIVEVGFNIEERDGVNVTSTLAGGDDLEAFARFFARIVERYREHPDRLRIREIDQVVDALLDPMYGRYRDNAQNCALGIVSVAWDGSLSTFSPELLGTSHPDYGTFSFGNVHTGGIGTMLKDLRFRRIAKEIAAGIACCRRSCPYFTFCRGGAPANKLGELGHFKGNITLFCQMTQMTVIETVLAALEADLGPGRASRQPMLAG
jgi:uncharacterized protein